MSLDPDAAALIAQAEAAGVRYPELGVAESRRLTAAVQRPPGPELFDVLDRECPGPRGPIGLRVYRPGPEPDLPIVVYFHGGGMCLGSLDMIDNACRHVAEAAGCVVVSVDYRLAPEHRFPEPFEDAYAAANWVAEHAADLGGDPVRVAIAGDSAGATLAAAVTIEARNRSGPRFVQQILVYPSTEDDFDTESMRTRGNAVLDVETVKWFRAQHLGDADPRDPRVAPAYAADHAGLPPALILTAEYDVLRDDGERYAHLLETAGVPTRLLRYPGLPHGFFSRIGTYARSSEALNDVAHALRDAFAAAGARG
jgi:acetyl esterase